MMHRIASVALLLFLAPAFSSADDVILKNGGKLSGKVTDLGTKIKLERPDGITVTIPKDQIAGIIPKKTPPLPKKKPAPRKPAAKPPVKKPAKPVPAAAKKTVKEDSSFDSKSPQIESMEYLPDRNHVLLHIAGNVPTQVRKIRDWSLAHDHGLEVQFTASGREMVCLQQSSGEFGKPVLHRVGSTKKKTEFIGSITQGITCTTDADWIVGWRSSYLVIWNRKNPQKPEHLVRAFKSRIHEARVLPDNRNVLIHGDKSWAVWDIKAGQKKVTLDYTQIDGFTTLGTALSSDGKVLVLWSRDKVAKVDPVKLTVTQGKPLQIKLTRRAWLSPTGAWLTAAVEGPQSPREHPLGVVSTATLQAAEPAPDLPAMRFFLPNSVAFSADDKFMGIIRDKKSISVFSTASWTEVSRHALEKNEILAAAFSIDGKQMLLADEDSRVHVMNWEKVKE